MEGIFSSGTWCLCWPMRSNCFVDDRMVTTLQGKSCFLVVLGAYVSHDV